MRNLLNLSIAIMVVLCMLSSCAGAQTESSISKNSSISKEISMNDSSDIIAVSPEMDSPPYMIDANICLYPACDKDTGLHGYIDKQGEWVITPQYKDAMSFEEGVAHVTDLGGQTKLINSKGNDLLKLPPDINFRYYSNGMILASDGSNYLKPGYINWKGEWMSDVFDEASPFAEGLAWARKDSDLFGYINKNMELIIPQIFEKADAFSEGLACVKKDGKYGYIEINGEWAIKPQYNSASKFCLGYASVEVAKKWGIIDKNGTFIIEPSFGPIVITEDGIANGVLSAHESFVLWGGIGTKFSVGLIDLKGNWITEPIYGSDIVFQDGVGITNFGISMERIGLDYKGNVIIEPKYSLYHRGGGIIEFYRDGQYDSWMNDYPDTQFNSLEDIPVELGYMDVKGNIIYQH